MTQSIDHPWPEFALDRLRSAQSVVVLTGAGMSAESGIPTFRDALAGHWSRFRPEELATPEAFRLNPARVWDWYEERRGAFGPMRRTRDITHWPPWGRY